MTDSADLPQMLLVLDDQLDALKRFVGAYAALDPTDTSPDERRRLDEVQELLNAAMDRFH